MQLKERATFIHEMWEEGQYYFITPTAYDEKTIRNKWSKETPRHLNNLKEKLVSLNNFSSENIENVFKAYLEESKIGMGKLLPQFRLSLTGLAMGPSLFEIASLIGKKETLKRIEIAIIKIQQ